MKEGFKQYNDQNICGLCSSYKLFFYLKCNLYFININLMYTFKIRLIYIYKYSLL